MSVIGQRALLLDIGDQRWALEGGWEEDGILGLRFAVVSGDDVAKFSARIPVTTDGETLELGTPEISEGWPE